MNLRAWMLLAAFLGSDDPDFQNPAHPVEPLLSQIPGVESVKVVKARVQPTHRIVHLLNWHFIPRKMFASDLRDQSDKPISDGEIDRRYVGFLAEVEKVQHEQAVLIRAMIQQHGVRRVHYEGFSKSEVAAFRRLVVALRNFEKHKPKGDSPIEQFLLGEFRADLLRVGAPGRLMMSGELDEVLPIDDITLLKAANPVQADGTVRLDWEIIERREDAMVKHLLEGGQVTVVVLGGAHDLSNNIPKSCEYVRVKTRRYAEAAEGILESVSKDD